MMMCACDVCGWCRNQRGSMHSRTVMRAGNLALQSAGLRVEIVDVSPACMRVHLHACMHPHACTNLWTNSFNRVAVCPGVSLHPHV